jgi:DNA-binding NarL/FixJ family response regulator
MSKSYNVVIVEVDFYARMAINSYLAWDRRTRATDMLSTTDDLLDHLRESPEREHPDTILLDDTLIPTSPITEQLLKEIHDLSAAHVIVMAQDAREDVAHAVYQAGGRGYVIREDVGLQVSWMIGWSRQYDFVVTPKSAYLFPEATVLPDGREYPELTDRVRQALMLCVVEGMSAELAADEMGLSPHTIRTYVKEGYSILEASDHDQMDIPPGLSPTEKAFLRFTALTINQMSDEERQLPDKDELS